MEGSFVEINSLSIDLRSPMEERALPAVHEHFSIRGFVAGMRKKDPKICLPFSSNGDGCDILPPLVVPNFQWWQCSSGIASERSTVEMAVTGRDDTFTNSCDNLDLDKDGFMSLQEDIGNKHVSRDSGDEEDNYLGNANANLKIISNDGPKASESSKDKTEEGNSCADMTEVNRLQITDRNKNNAGASDKLPSAEHSSCRVDEPENVSSGSEKTLSATPQKRKPKLRSLADILVEERNPATENSRPRVQATSTETEAGIGGSQNQLNVPVEAAKGIRSKSKRKISREEDREVPLGKTNPNGEAAKRLKGPILDAERTRRVVQISDTESEDDAQVSAKIQRMKPKKCKPLDINKKMTRAHTDDRAPPITELPKIDSPSSANIQKHAIFGKSGETGRPNFKSFLFGQQLERMSTLSKSNRPEVEAVRNSLMPPNKITLGDSSGKGKMALELSLNSFVNGESSSSKQPLFKPNNNRGIPDLNETFTHKTTMIPIDPEKRSFNPQRSFNLERSFHLQRNLDLSASISKFSAAEIQRQLANSEHQTAQKSYNNNMEQVGASEMAVVELLARHKREKELRSLRKNLQPVRINSTTGGSPSLYPNGQAGTSNFPFVNRTSATTVENSNADPESEFCVFPTIIPFHHRKTPHSAPSTSTLQGPRTSGGPEMLWRQRTDYAGPFNFQSRPVQTNRTTSVPIFSNGSHKGKTISDIKGIEERRTIQEPCQLKEGRIGSNSTSARSFDSFSNDAIPAMQLLSMMNQRIASNSSFKAGSRGFLDKTFSPCNYHPRVNNNENRNFINSSFFPQERHSKDVPGSSYVGSCSGVQKAASSMQGQRAFEQRNSKVINLEGTNNIVIQAALKYPPLGDCTLNKNPADFSYPNSRNKYTLTSKDYEPKESDALKEKPRSSNAVAQKRQKVRKEALGSGKEYLRK